MKKQTKSSWQIITSAVFAAFVFLFAANSAAAGQTKYKPGDRVECDPAASDRFEKRTVLPYNKYDKPAAANYYRVRLESGNDPNDMEGSICPINRMRPPSQSAETGNETESKEPSIDKSTENKKPFQPRYQ